jgi:16S rRNA (cytosine1402-N4)-methyltransferase
MANPPRLSDHQVCGSAKRSGSLGNVDLVACERSAALVSPDPADVLEMADRNDHNPAIGGFRVAERRRGADWPERRRCRVSVGAMTSGAGHPSGHDPVLPAEMLAALAVRDDGTYLDATFGAGGYSRAILAAGAGRVVALDRDPAAVAGGRALARAWRNFTMIEGCFGDVAALLGACGITRLDGAVFDLGVCSTQLEDAARGFSFMRDGPLDMRMSGSGISAADVVNDADEATLADILYRYGEERASRRIARAIIERRRSAPIRSTAELASLIAGVLGRQQGRIDPATRSFQALRIHVNDELGELERALAAMPGLLAPGGRLVVVAFHSLEDRLVKRFMSEHSDRQARPSRHLPDLPSRPEALFRPLSSRAIRPGPAEIAANPRARSARLRAALRLPDRPAHENLPCP